MLALLALEGFLLLSAWFRWFPFNQHKGWTVLITVASVGVALLLMALWFLAALVFRLRFQFSLLALLLLVVVVAVPFSWLETEMKAARKQREAVASIERAGGSVMYDYELPWVYMHHWPPPATPWLRTLLGIDFFANVELAGLRSEPNDSLWEDLGAFAHLRILELQSAKVGDAELRNLRGLPPLRELDVGGTNVSDAGLLIIAGLAQLKT